MTAERWARITDVFRAALEKPAGERKAFLDEACSGDEALRREIEKLLADEAESSLHSPLLELLEGSAVELASGDMLAHYRVEAKLGEGGMGVVYRAYDTRLHRAVALKVISDALADPDRVGRLMREARAASSLNHPNIVTIYEVGSDRGVDFIAMELVSGQTLARQIGRRGLALRDTLKHAVQIASALAAAHRACIVHRDLKPANIMVDDAGHVKVLDFGLAKRTERAAGEEAGSTHAMEPETDKGTVFGTVAYMSPEQAEGKKLDARSDIFSFGVVLYEMVTGKRAFERDSIAATLAAILKEEPVPPGELAGGLPPDLEKIVMRCLRKDPARRFQHMDDVEVALEELREASDSGALETAGPARLKRFRKLPWAAGLALLLAAAAAGVWMVRFRAPVPEAALVPVPLTSYPGAEGCPSFSPDGTQVAFRWCPEGKTCQIYVKQIGVEPPFRLTDSAAPSDSPAWSPDGRTIAAIRQLSATRLAVILIPQRGGRERVLAAFDDYSNEIKRWTRLSGPFLAWTPDSKYLVSQVSEPSDSSRERCALFLFSVETGEKRRLTTPPDGLWLDTTPAFSPDGRTLAFSRGNGDQYDLYLSRLAEGYAPQTEPERIASGNLMNLGAAWTPDGSEIVFSSGNGLWRVATAASARPRRLALAAEFASQPAISRQGNRLAYTLSRANSNIWRVDLGGPGRKPGIPVKFIASSNENWDPAYSPDGTRIAFVSNRSGTAEIWVSGSDGSNAAQLTSLGGPGISGPQWSPGGENIAFQAWPGGNNDVYAIGANGGALRRLTTNPALDKWPSWSRDGKWLYFSSERSRPCRVWKMPAAGGEAVRITPGEGDVPRETPDGKWLYYHKKSQARLSLWRMPVDGGREAKVLDAVGDPTWTVGKEGIYFTTEPDKQGRSNFCVQEFATGKIRTVGTTERPVLYGMAVSPDSRTLLYTQLDDPGRDLMLVENFR